MRNRVEIKREAKSILRSAQVSPLLVTAIFLLVGLVLDRILSLVEFGTLFPEARIMEYMDYLSKGDPLLYGMDPDTAMAMAGLTARGTIFSTFFSFLVSLFMTVLSGGYYIYCMGVRQGLRMPCSTLLDGLGVAGRLIWCSILMSIKITLWSMLFVIPGLVAAYRYRFALYNVLTDDSLTAGQAIRLSCEQTRGIKGDLFLLDLSFFGWSLLSALTLGILNLWLTPYMTLSDLGYFEDAQRRLGRSPYGAEMPPQVDAWEQ